MFDAKTRNELNSIIQTKKEGKETIQEILRVFENHFNITILYAVEGGSRAYNIHTKNSDYDIKFIYVKKPESYISLDESLQTIKYVDESKQYDFIGYDLKKALKLCKKSNPSMYEMSKSDKIYVRSELFDNIIFFKTALYNHYRGMLHSQYKKYHETTMTESKNKKYLHMLRVYIMINWMLDFNERPPLDMKILVDYIESQELRKITDKLIQRKLLNVEELYLLNNKFSTFLNNTPIESPFTSIKIINDSENSIFF